MHMKRKIIVVLGPTASGKSGVALALAKKLGGFLISADSRQVFKFMDIGTNKDKGKWRSGCRRLPRFARNDASLRAARGDASLRAARGDASLRAARGDKGYIREYLVDVVEPDESFSVWNWVEAVNKVLKKEKGQAIIVGGTGLYISALAEGYDLPGQFDAKMRACLEKQVDKYDLGYLIAKMKKYDPDIEKKIDTKNPRRVIRAAEIILQTKKPLDQDKGESPYEFLKIGMDVPRERLYEKINARVDVMINEGLVDEVKKLLARGYQVDSSAMSGIGYRQIVQYLDGEISLERAVELIKRDTRRYAKRQMTWWRRDGSIRWVKSLVEAEEVVGRARVKGQKKRENKNIK